MYIHTYVCGSFPFMFSTEAKGARGGDGERGETMGSEGEFRTLPPFRHPSTEPIGEMK